MIRSRSVKKKDDAYESEVASELASDFSSDERGDAEVVEPQEVDFINEYKNGDDEGTFKIPPPKKRRVGILSAEKRGDFNEALGKLRVIN